MLSKAVQRPNALTAGRFSIMLRDMPRGRLIGFAFLGLSLVLAGQILFDLWPALRGPAPGTSEWHWPYALRPVGRWWPAILAAILLLVAGKWWDKRRPHRAWPLAVVAGLTLGLQLAIVYAERPQIGAELVDRTLSKDTSGYAAIAGEIDDLAAALRDFPALMPSLDNEHARTHPPGLIAAFWLTDHALRGRPALAEFISEPARLWRCTDLWVISRPPATAAALLIGAFLPLLCAALVPVAAYLLGRRLGNASGARWAALFAASLPALLIFSPTPDQIYALLALVSLWLVVAGIQRGRSWLIGLGGLVLSWMTMLSIGNVAWGVVVFLMAVFAMRRAHYDVRPLVSGLAVLAFGVASIWLVYWVGWGVAPWEVILTGLAQHRELVTVHRSYGLWLVYNPLDFVLFAGLAVTAGLLLAGVAAMRDGGQRRTPIGLLALILLLTLLALNLSGATRGEVGRLWLLFMPAAAVVAGGYWSRVVADRLTLLLILASQLVLALAIGLAWRPIQAVILPVARPDFTAGLEATMTPLGVTFQSPGNRPVTLEGFEIVANEGGPSAGVNLVWSSRRPTMTPYVVFIHVLDAGGQLVAQHDGWPVEGQWPTTCWTGDKLIPEVITIPLPDGLPAGRYTIISGLYDALSGERLIAAGNQDHVQLGYLTLQP